MERVRLKNAHVRRAESAVGCRGQKSAHAIIKKKPFTASFLLHMIKTAKNRNSCVGRLWL